MRWHIEGCTGACLACLIEETVLENYGTQGLDFLRRKVGAGDTAEEGCGHCCGTGRMVRDPDIGTDQECFVCEGSGVVHNAELRPQAGQFPPVAP